MPITLTQGWPETDLRRTVRDTFAKDHNQKKTRNFRRPTWCADPLEVIANRRNRGRLATSSPPPALQPSEQTHRGIVELDGCKGRILKKVLKRYEEDVP